VTNGTLITSEIAKSLKSINNLSIQISLDGYSKDVHEMIRGKNTYNKTIKGIKLLVSEGHQVYLSPIVTSELFNELKDYFYLAKELGVMAVFLQPINDVGRAKTNDMKRVNDAEVFKKLVELYEDDPELIKYIPGTLECKYVTNIKLLNKCMYCGTGSATLTIQPDGTCYPCPNNICSQMKIGNILTDDFEKLWYHSPILARLRNLNVDTNLAIECSECIVKHFCGGGCRGVTLQNTGDISGLSPYCNYEKAQRIEMLWVAAQKPYLFESEVSRTLHNDELSELETKEVLLALGLK
jgi:radical SAM protein with 4Fe4S-binding SPASM domain